jgi:predicted aspartyl protease
MKPLLDPQVKALLEVGFIKFIDVVFLLSWIAAIVAAIVFSRADNITRLLTLLFAQCAIIGAWLVVLAYRTCYQVIMARSDINTMPDAAAKLAIAYKAK